MKELYNKALKIATEARAGQFDKAGKTYITHPIGVSERCTLLEEKIVALLHDTLEDTCVTEDYLLSEGFPQPIVDAVKSVTCLPGETYRAFILRSSSNPIGRIVKIHDLEDNMDITRLPDEFDVKIHPLLTCKIISLFNSASINPKNAKTIMKQMEGVSPALAESSTTVYRLVEELNEIID